jgi:hypothetical protein
MDVRSTSVKNNLYVRIGDASIGTFALAIIPRKEVPEIEGTR